MNKNEKFIIEGLAGEKSLSGSVKINGAKNIVGNHTKADAPVARITARASTVRGGSCARRTGR